MVEDVSVVIRACIVSMTVEW